MADICPLLKKKFTWFIVQHLGHLLSLASKPCQIRTFSRGLRYCGFIQGFNISERFRRGFRNGPMKLAVISARAGSPDPPIFVDGLRSCRRVASIVRPRCCCGGLVGFLVSRFPGSKMAPKLLEGLLRILRDMSWEVFSLRSCFLFMGKWRSR